jgi:hypothetical protein
MGIFPFSRAGFSVNALLIALTACSGPSTATQSAPPHVNPLDSNMGIQVNNNFSATIYPISSTGGDCPWVTTSPPYPVGAGGYWGTQLVYSTSCSPHNNGPDYELTYGPISTDTATTCIWKVAYTGGIHFSFSAENGTDTDCTVSIDTSNSILENLNYNQTSALRRRHIH